jgi:hypothetical protein
MDKTQFLTKLEKFLTLLTADTADRYKGITSPVAKASKPGKIYTRVYLEDSQKMSRYFVSNFDGKIFACSSWKAPNFNRCFGTLDTIDQFYWGDYEGRAKPGTSFTMKAVAGGSGYMTAIPK